MTSRAVRTGRWKRVGAALAVPAMALSLIGQAAAPSVTKGATYRPWYDDVGQTPNTLDLAADGSYGFVHLRWQPARHLDVANSDGTRIARGAIYERVCWGFIPGHDDNPQPFCKQSGSKWTTVGRVSLAFADPIVDDLGSQWAVVRVQTTFAPRWRRLNRRRAGGFSRVGEVPGDSYGYLLGATGEVPDFSPVPLTGRQYRFDLEGGSRANCLANAYRGGPHGWATAHTFTTTNMTCGAAASALARARLERNANTGLITPGFECRVLSETTVKHDPYPVHELVRCSDSYRAFTVSLS
jgi:hypothetical protein